MVLNVKAGLRLSMDSNGRTRMCSNGRAVVVIASGSPQTAAASLFIVMMIVMVCLRICNASASEQ